MTVHATRTKRQAQGAKTGNMVRVMCSLDPDDMRRITWWANKKGVPVAYMLRLAVWAYLRPIAEDADRAARAAE